MNALGHLRRELARLGLQLPTEAQWEYAARAGTTTPRWTGVEEESLDSHAGDGRSANRGHVPPDYADAQLGVRPAMCIRPCGSGR